MTDIRAPKELTDEQANAWRRGYQAALEQSDHTTDLLRTAIEEALERVPRDAVCDSACDDPQCILRRALAGVTYR